MKAYPLGRIGDVLTCAETRRGQYTDCTAIQDSSPSPAADDMADHRQSPLRAPTNSNKATDTAEMEAAAQLTAINTRLVQVSRLKT